MRDVSARTAIGSTFVAVALSAMLVGAQTSSGPARLNGAWVLNRQQSSGVGTGADPAPEGGGPRHGGFSGGFGHPGGGGMGRGNGGSGDDRESLERQRALVHELLEPLPRITVTSDNESVTFAASDGRVRKYRIDGKKEKHQFDNGTVDTKSKWENEQLIIETSTSGGMKLVESYSVNDQHQLVVDVKFGSVRGSDRPPILHVYDDASALQ
jgi:hypothetical protein